MLRKVQLLGRHALAIFDKIGLAGIFLMAVIFRRPRFKQGIQLLTYQLYQVGVLSLIIILLSALFIGMVLALEGYHTLHKFSAALLFAGRAGSALTAEIGLMRATEQLSCMEMMAVDPLWRVISPRFWAGFISLPLLTILFNVVAIYGGYAISVHWLGVHSGVFWNNMQASVDFRSDIMNGIIKSVVFGFVVTWIAVYQGYFCESNSAGIARATTKTVVYSSLMVLAMDFILTSMMINAW